MRRVRRLRALLHRPYLRAVVAAVAIAAAGGAIATVALELRFAVPGRAVVRFFARRHSTADDLRPLLRQPTTLAALEKLYYTTAGMNPGGLVYSDGQGLRFHPWMPAGAEQAATGRAIENQAVYWRLLPRYLAAELDELIIELSQPEVRRSLGRLGISPRIVEELRRQAAADPPPTGRRRLLRRAAGLIRPFMPSGADRHRLDLADKLRFYASVAPRGRYLGLYEVRGPSLLSPAAPDPLPETGRLLTITKEIDGEILVEDHRPSGRRVYRLTPVPHPAGLPLYRLGRRA
jgi:hypothetical protein